MASPESSAGSGSGLTVTWSKILETEEEYLEYLNSRIAGPDRVHETLSSVAEQLLAENENREGEYVPVDLCLVLCQECNQLFRHTYDLTKKYLIRAPCWSEHCFVPKSQQRVV